MTRYLLDTDVCIELLRGRAAGVYERLRKLAIDEVGISSITLAELQYGATKSSRPAHHLTLLAEFCTPLAILSFDDLAAEAYGKVRTILEKEGVPIGPLDTLIAAHAVAVDAVLITNNEKEFRRVADLRVENWL